MTNPTRDKSEQRALKLKSNLKAEMKWINSHVLFLIANMAISAAEKYVQRERWKKRFDEIMGKI